MSMPVDFHKSNSNDVCSICWDTMANRRDVIAHNGPYGDTHPWHRECIKGWMAVRPECPGCQVPLDMGSLFSWKERVEIITKDAVAGLKTGALVGATILTAGVAGAVLGAGIPPALAVVFREPITELTANLAKLSGISIGYFSGFFTVFHIMRDGGDRLGAAGLAGIAASAILKQPTTMFQVGVGILGAAVVGGVSISVINGLLSRRGLPHL